MLRGGGTALFDCGEGTSRQFIKSSVKPSALEAIFITHLHGDHIYGIPGVAMRCVSVKTPSDPIKVFGPRGLRRMFNSTFDHNTHLKLSELKSAAAGGSGFLTMDPIERCFHVFENEHFTVKAAPIKHSVFCLGYVIQEKSCGGNLLVDKIKEELGLSPSPLFKRFKTEKIIQLPDGRIIQTADFVSPERKGRKIVILGDTFDPSDIAHLSIDADVLVHEATNSNEEYSIAIQHKHSTAGMAGKFARMINAKSLIMTHFSPRNFNSDFDEMGHIKLLIDQARAEFGKSAVYAASDFWRFKVPPTS